MTETTPRPNHLPWKLNGTSIYFANVAGGFDVRNCPDPVNLAAFIHLACNSHYAQARELKVARILIASMQPVVNAASVFVTDFQSDAVCGESEEASCDALIEAVDGYRRELAAIDLARGQS